MMEAEAKIDNNFRKDTLPICCQKVVMALVMALVSGVVTSPR